VPIEFYVKKGKSDWKRVFKFPPLDWCKTNSGTSGLFSLQKMIIKLVENSASEFIHECPYQGIHSANFNVSKEYLQLIPLGDFRIIASLSDKIDNNVITLNVTFIIF
jgi:hypothetical protein